MKIPSYLFGNLTFSEKMEIDNAYNIYEYMFLHGQYCQLTSKAKITKSSIELSKLLMDKLNLDVFPLIDPVAVKGYAVNGQTKFMMYSKDREYSFVNVRKDYKKSSNIKLNNRTVYVE